MSKMCIDHLIFQNKDILWRHIWNYSNATFHRYLRYPDFIGNMWTFEIIYYNYMYHYYDRDDNLIGDLQF